jgi:hypothetical protein
MTIERPMFPPRAEEHCQIISLVDRQKGRRRISIRGGNPLLDLLDRARTYCRVEAGRADRLPQPLHRELDIRRLQMAPAFDLGLVSILRVPCG